MGIGVAPVCLRKICPVDGCRVPATLCHKCGFVVVVVRYRGYLSFKIVCRSLIFIGDGGALGQIVITFIFFQINTKSHIGVVLIFALRKDDSIDPCHILCRVPCPCSLNYDIVIFIVQCIGNCGRTRIPFVCVGIPNAPRIGVLIAILKVINIISGRAGRGTRRGD